GFTRISNHRENHALPADNIRRAWRFEAQKNREFPARCVQTRALFALGNLHSQNQVAARDAIDYFHTVDDLPEDGVAAVQMRLWRMRDEELAAAGVLAREGHSDRAASVRPGVDLTAELITGAALAVASRVAPLDDEIRHDAMKSQVVEEIPLR